MFFLNVLMRDSYDQFFFQYLRTYQYTTLIDQNYEPLFLINLNNSSKYNNHVSYYMSNKISLESKYIVYLLRTTHMYES